MPPSITGLLYDDPPLPVASYMPIKLWLLGNGQQIYLQEYYTHALLTINIVKTHNNTLYFGYNHNNNYYIIIVQ